MGTRDPRPNFAAPVPLLIPAADHMYFFHCPNLPAGAFELPEDEAHHARSVLRLSTGVRIGLLDGKGTVAEAVVVAIDKRQVLVNVVTSRMISPESKARIHLAVSPTKQIERFEWLLEKCTEIGVDRITPLITTRTERARLRHDRLERVLIGAMKQSQRAWLPRLDEATTINELISGGVPAQRSFGWCEGDNRSFASCYRPKEDALILIGSEGDFTPAEAQHLISSGFVPVSLGKSRLRTETAAITACTWMNFAQLL